MKRWLLCRSLWHRSPQLRLLAGRHSFAAAGKGKAWVVEVLLEFKLLPVGTEGARAVVLSLLRGKGKGASRTGDHPKYGQQTLAQFPPCPWGALHTVGLPVVEGRGRLRKYSGFLFQSFCQDRWVLKVVTEFTAPIFGRRVVDTPDNTLHQEILEKEFHALKNEAVVRVSEEVYSLFQASFIAPKKNSN